MNKDKLNKNDKILLLVKLALEYNAQIIAFCSMIVAQSPVNDKAYNKFTKELHNINDENNKRISEILEAPE